MKLADVMSASGLSMYAIVALLLFFGAFLLVIVLIFAPGAKARHKRAARLPLDDDTVRPPEREGSDND
jgi:cbb3-type cytochrome oxidase subunit 3